MVVIMLIMRLIHILGGVLWAGWAFSLVAFIEPATRAAGPEGGKFMQALTGKTKLLLVMTVAPLLVVLSGVAMFWPVSGGFSGAWLASKPGMALTIGSLAGILAYIYSSFITRPAAARLGTLSKQMQSADSPPSPDLMAEMSALQGRFSRGGLHAAILLAVSVIGMSVARYLY